MTPRPRGDHDFEPVRSMPIALPHTAERATRFFLELTEGMGPERRDSKVIIVTHILPDRPPMLLGLSQLAQVALILAKPRSVDEETRTLLEASYPLATHTRDELADLDVVTSLIDRHVADGTFTILDIGGYFAPVAAEIAARYPDQLLGIVEDTENGQQRYERVVDRLPVPVFSVARSPLKEPEDHLVGESVVFSMERLIRECGEVVYGRRAVVFGYGKIGRSAARALSIRGVRVSVVDTNPIRAVEAQAHGFRPLSKASALATGDLILGATGAFSLREADFQYVRNGSFIASVTSSDDELDIAGLPGRYSIEHISNGVTCYSRLGQYFYVLNRGNAVNFIDGAVVGPFIYLVQGEILAALAKCQAGGQKTGYVREVGSATRQKIAAAWMRAFNDNRIIIPGTL